MYPTNGGHDPKEPGKHGGNPAEHFGIKPHDARKLLGPRCHLQFLKIGRASATHE